ncbi:MAG: acyl-CoA thioesterase [Armatimonadetes bacterium]|nr:acyl-CoA thioesterase [Armatimonadota bacterium]
MYRTELTVPADVIDENGHVNNVAFVQWMQDVATAHFDALGGREPMRAAGATWVARSHWVEYLGPAFAGDKLVILTWIATAKRVRSLRRYQFRRAEDDKLLVRGETDWVLITTATGRPCQIPDAMRQAFTLVPPEQEP